MEAGIWGQEFDAISGQWKCDFAGVFEEIDEVFAHEGFDVFEGWDIGFAFEAAGESLPPCAFVGRVMEDADGFIFFLGGGDKFFEF